MPPPRRNRIACSARPHRVNDAVGKVIEETGALKSRLRRAVDSTILSGAVATQDTVTQLVAAVRKVAREVPRAAEQVARVCTEISRTPVPVPRSLALELAAHVKDWPGETLLTGRDGGQLPPWALKRAVRTARGKVDGLPDGFRYHDLRHYFASLLIASGAEVKTVQARLRHASVQTTLDTYGHLWPDRDESTRAAVDAVLASRVANPAD